MKVLVTGGTGFIGSKLVERLLRRGASVTGLVRTASFSKPDVKTIVGDLTYPDFIFTDEYDIVYHLAATWPGEKNKKILRKVNYDGTVNLFSAIKEKTKFFVYISGLGVFGNPGETTIDEDSSLRPHTEYAKIRLEAQKFLELNCKDLGIGLSIAYLGDVYGDGGWFKNILIERLKKGSFRIPGSGEYYRSFVHVDDAVSVLVAIAEKNAVNQSYVITDSNPIKFREFVNFVANELKVKQPGTVPTLLAKAVMGGEFVNLLTTSVRTSNAKISKLCELVYKSYQDGVRYTISEMKL